MVTSSMIKNISFIEANWQYQVMRTRALWLHVSSSLFLERYAIFLIDIEWKIKIT